MSVETIYQQMDVLYMQSMEQIDGLAQQEVSESYDEARTERVKKTVGYLQQMSGLLEVAGLITKQLPHALIQRDFLDDRLDIYRSKYGHLREVLKKKQLENYAMESEFIHQQRLRQYEIDLERTAESENTTDGDREKEGNDNGDKEGDEEEVAMGVGETRKRLFSGRSAKPAKKSVDDQLLQQNKDISSSLRKSKQLMTMSIMQTELNIDTLDQQSQDLRKLNDKLVDLDDLLGKSKQIVRFIEKQDKSDKRRIYFALGFLVLCSVYVLYRRVLKMPLRILMWTFLKTFGVLHWVSEKTFKPEGSLGNPASFESQIKEFTESTSILETFSVLAPDSTATMDSDLTPDMDFNTPYVQEIHMTQSMMTWTPESSEVADGDRAEGEGFEEKRKEDGISAHFNEEDGLELEGVNESNEANKANEANEVNEANEEVRDNAREDEEEAHEQARKINDEADEAEEVEPIEINEINEVDGVELAPEDVISGVEPVSEDVDGVQSVGDYGGHDGDGVVVGQDGIEQAQEAFPYEEKKSDETETERKQENLEISEVDDSENIILEKDSVESPNGDGNPAHNPHVVEDHNDIEIAHENGHDEL